MTTIISKDGNSLKVNGTAREKSPRPKNSRLNKQSSRDSLSMINERNATSAQSIDQDDDSETENLSPLLYTNKKSQMKHVKKIAGSPGSTSSSSSSSAQMQTSPSTQLQPQLQKQQPQISQSQTALHIDGVNENIDDTTDADDREIEVCEDDSWPKYLLSSN